MIPVSLPMDAEPRRGLGFVELGRSVAIWDNPALGGIRECGAIPGNSGIWAPFILFFWITLSQLEFRDLGSIILGQPFPWQEFWDFGLHFLGG